tara:strand:+ start:19447 stop:20736 length:1290 start_codon:yes stop_codon:yes gene_type:complete
MLGNHFYNQRIRKAVAVFGSLFNDIKIVRTDAAGKSLSQQKVPLSYSPKRDFVARIEAMGNGEEAERQIALKLPRMGFEIVAMQYDAIRQLPKMNNCITMPSTYDGTGSKLYTPVPYTISFQLNIYSKTQDDALQIVEQVLPFFTPNYTVSIKPIEGQDIVEDSPITLTGVVFSDDYEAAIEQRRTIIYTLDFDMKINLYKGTSTGTSIIEEACVEFMDLSGEELFSKVCADSAWVVSPLSGTLNEDAQFISSNFKLLNLPNIPTSITVSDPANGTASYVDGSILGTADSAVSLSGQWIYQANADYNGLDTFNIIVDGTFGTRSFPVNMTILPLEDAFNGSIFTTTDVPHTFFITDAAPTNSFSSSNITYSVAAGGDPSNGTIEVLNASTGQFRYTPSVGYTGSDLFVYRATPADGTSEVGTINILISV